MNDRSRRFPACTTNGSWYATVAVYATDLDPSAAANATVRATSSGVSALDGTASASTWSVRYENVAIFGHPDAGQTFGASLYDDGRVEIVHEDVVDSRSLVDASGHMARARPRRRRRTFYASVERSRGS